MFVGAAEIKKMIAATLLSLAAYSLANQAIEWGAHKCPWDTKRVKLVAYIVIALVSAWILFGHFKARHAYKHQRRQQKAAIYSQIGVKAQP